MFSLAEKHPFLLERRWGVRAYDYRWGYTVMQIELGVIDAPLINYGSKDKKKAKAYKKEDLDNLAMAWEKNRGGKTFAGGKFTVDELFDNTEDETENS